MSAPTESPTESPKFTCTYRGGRILQHVQYSTVRPACVSVPRIEIDRSAVGRHKALAANADEDECFRCWRSYSSRAAASRIRCNTVVERYDALVASNSLRPNPQQRELADRLADLQKALDEHAQASKLYSEAIKSWRAEVSAIEQQHKEKVRRAEDQWRAQPMWRRMLGSVGRRCTWTRSSESSSTTGETQLDEIGRGQRLPEIVPVPRMPRHHAETDSEAGGCGSAGCGSADSTGASGASGCSGAGGPASGDSARRTQSAATPPRALGTPLRAASELSEEERNHPFWRSGIGASALKRIEADENGCRDGANGGDWRWKNR